MMVDFSRRRALLMLMAVPVPLAAGLAGCGEDSSKIAVLPDQGKLAPQSNPNDLKPKKGMDRNGS